MQAFDELLPARTLPTQILVARPHAHDNKLLANVDAMYLAASLVSRRCCTWCQRSLSLLFSFSFDLPPYSHLPTRIVVTRPPAHDN